MSVWTRADGSYSKLTQVSFFVARAVITLIENNVCAWVFMRSREGYFGVSFSSCEATMEINNKITLEWAQRLFVTRVHTLFHFLCNITNPLNDDKNDDLYTSSPCFTRAVFVLLMTSHSIDDDVILTRQLRRDHVKSDISLVKYRFRHGDIHDRSRKKHCYLQSLVLTNLLYIFTAKAVTFRKPVIV